jgi:hypothetical protein
MIRKVIFIFVVITIILNSTYGQYYYRKIRADTTVKTNITSNSPVNSSDDYYDYYDYAISNGYKQEMNKTFLFCFILLYFRILFL